ncbi:BON domain-containing protein [Paraburkholderia silvatlantica]|uniref:Osmotically-inducible protein OsmY n=1 Tax=Paraburkholderia silvatlantica TaxID=321895 RepID=A0ABR6FUW2_9BURK|nr:BON domain-containing protein [Paraburkholderia silvatlantica]MBB2931225.1 osmotically-inducible protein OsmY [Paraburkholderia silvatlantica]
MKISRIITALSVCAIVTVLSTAYSQPVQPTSGSSSVVPDRSATKKEQRKANRKLGVDVRRALEQARIDVSSVVVQTNAGAVMLIGTVPDASQIARAEAVARGVVGVTVVNNRLTIRPEP